MMGAARSRTNGNADQGQPPSGTCWLALYLATDLIVALGLGGLAAHDLQRLTQQSSLGGEVSYLLTHSDALLHLPSYIVSYVVFMGILSSARLVLNHLAPHWAANVADAIDAWLQPSDRPHEGHVAKTTILCDSMQRKILSSELRVAEVETVVAKETMR